MNEQNDMPGIAGLILAAGFSSRMGETKALLRFGDETLIGRQIKCFLKAGVINVFVVTGHDAHIVAAAANAYPVRTIYNQYYKDGMFTSVKAGLRAAKREGCTAVFLLPVDCALVTPDMLDKLAMKFKENGKKIVYPSHKKEKGHPPIFSAELIDEILAYNGEGGLKAALARYEDEAAFVEAGSGCLLDMDTKEEYRQTLKRLDMDEGSNV
jgi:CTP:molybdopterin cytidylyltransferase MocA